MKAIVIIRLKEGVLDPQGEAVRQSMRLLDKTRVKDVRIGKIIEIELDSEDKSSAQSSVKAMCEKLLANPVMEDYQIVDIS